ncbi:MAG: spore germination protein [Clostridia bacterium]|nr:spore germination protein [Clostridia bacterium]
MFEKKGLRHNPDRLERNLDKNIQEIKLKMKNDRYLVIGNISNFLGEFTIIYMVNMTNKDLVNRHIVSTIKKAKKNNQHLKKTNTYNWVDHIGNHVLDSVDIKKSLYKSEIISEIVSGNTCILFCNSDKALIVGTKNYEKRSVEKAQTEVTILGSKEAFIEDLATNIALIRRRYKTDNLEFENFSLGSLSNTDVTVCWLKDIASERLVNDICQRISKIDVDFIYDVSMILQLIEDHPLSIWPQHALTERPDIVSNHLAEGKVAILCDNSPFAVILPVNIFHDVQSPDDYYERPLVGTFFRFIRYVGVFISIYLSPLYLAFIAYNHSIIPPDLAITISDGRVGVPFPSIVELLLMTFVIDMLREAGIRLPTAMGSAIGILGAVVIGQAAVMAGYVSASLVIIISITAIANFTIPSNMLFNAVRIINYAMIMAAGIFGIFGIHFLSVLLLWQLVRYHSFGVSLLYPIEPGKTAALKDIFVRGPIGKTRKNA